MILRYLSKIISWNPDTEQMDELSNVEILISNGMIEEINSKVSSYETEIDDYFRNQEYRNNVFEKEEEEDDVTQITFSFEGNENGDEDDGR